MNYNNKLKTNNENLLTILNTINSLPELPQLTNPALETDILLGKEAIVDGEKIVGNIETYNGTTSQQVESEFDRLITRTITKCINERVTTIGLYAFRECKDLEYVEMKNLISSANYVFQSSGIKTVKFQNLKKVSNGMFLDCTSLIDVYLPQTQTVYGTSFKNCTSLEKLDFPSLTAIYSNVFENCTNLKTIIFRSNTIVTLVNTNAFLNSGIANGNGIIYVNDDLVESYKTSTNWANYADRFKGISEYVEEE